MTPLVFLSGVLFASAAATGFMLALVWVIEMILALESPEVAAEARNLLPHALLFLAMTAICGAGFVGVLRQTPWRWGAQVLMWGSAVALIGFYAGLYGEG